MKFRVMLFLLLSTGLLQACYPTGPVRFYEGDARPASEIAKVKIPGPVTVKSIDGREVRVPSKEKGFYELQLPPGKHLVVFKYVRYWGTSETGLLIKSPLAAVDTEFRAGEVYELTYTRPKDEDEAFEFVGEFNATLVNLSSGKKTASFKVKDLDTLLATRAMIQDSNRPSPSAAASPMSAMPSADQAVQEDPVKRLKFWWLMADEKQRKEFSEWMKSATPSFGKE